MNALSLALVLAFCLCATALHLLHNPSRTGAAKPQDPHAQPCALLPSATRNEVASNRQANDNESVTNLHRRYIQAATNPHPNSLTVADHRGRLMTESDHDDTPQEPPTKQRGASP